MTWRAVVLQRDGSSMQLEGDSVAGLLSQFADLLGGPYSYDPADDPTNAAPFANVLRIAFVHVIEETAPSEPPIRGRELSSSQFACKPP